jgi:anaerobic ribonucleoside-triphosphate reductase activating protein
MWRGSANQPLVPLSPLGHKRYATLLTAEPDGKGKLQVSVDAEGVWYIGIPDRGDMGRLEAAARRRGVILGGVSWRA